MSQYNYNYEVNDKVDNESTDLLLKCRELGNLARSYESHSDGFGTEELSQDFINEFEELISESQKALDALKSKLKEHYPNLK